MNSGSIWVLVSTVSVADAGRTHLRPCGPDCESGLGDVEMLKRGIEPVRDHRNVRGLVARRRSSVFDAHERISKDRDERVRRVSISWCRSYGRDSRCYVQRVACVRYGGRRPGGMS